MQISAGGLFPGALYVEKEREGEGSRARNSISIERESFLDAEAWVPRRRRRRRRRYTNVPRSTKGANYFPPRDAPLDRVAK